jgi:phospholipase C
LEIFGHTSPLVLIKKPSSVPSPKLAPSEYPVTKNGFNIIFVAAELDKILGDTSDRYEQIQSHRKQRQAFICIIVVVVVFVYIDSLPEVELDWTQPRKRTFSVAVQLIAYHDLPSRRYVR